jgi:hypothetical protein
VFGLADEPGTARHQQQARPVNEDGRPVAVNGGAR